MAAGGDSSLKSLVYSREQVDNSATLEGMIFPDAAGSRPKSESSNAGDEQMDEAMLKQLLGDLPERLSDVAGLGNMPELTLMVEDDDVIAKFEDPDTARLLREISMDPSKLDELSATKEIKWMLDKLKEKKVIILTEPKYAEYRDKVQPPRM